jgi:NADPH:quinone reductase
MRMRAIEITQPGGPEVLSMVERDLPDPKAGEVLIKVFASGINRPDVLQRQGGYPPPPGASDLPGLEVAGQILGGDLSHAHNRCGFAPGDMVCALVSGGGYAEYCTAPLAQCLPVPTGLSVIEAASLPETFFTVWSNVFDRANLGLNEAGEQETLLVQGGSSGIGVAAIQLARVFGHEVFATAGSEEKCRAVEQLGASVCINYRTEDFVERVKELTEGRGVDVILDMVGGDYIPREMACLAPDGRIALIAVQGGSSTEIDLGRLLVKRTTITGSTLRPRSVAFKGAVAARLQQKVWPLLAEGTVRPIIHSTFDASQAVDAHKLMESSQHVGKILLRW